MQISSPSTGVETLMRLAVQRADTLLHDAPNAGPRRMDHQPIRVMHGNPRSLYMRNRETELKPLFDRIDQINMSQREKRLAKAYLLQADGISTRILWVTTGLKRLISLMFVKPVRRGIALVSKPANNARKLTMRVF